MDKGLIIGISIAAVILLLIIFIVSIYNKLAKSKIKVEEGFSTMDIYLKQRWDLIPNLVETVKGYAKHENDVLTEVTKMRNLNYGNMSMNEKVETNNKLSSALGRLLMLKESYPELKANENFKELSKTLNKIEEDIANSRKYYNATVREYNNLIKLFPSNIVASIFKFEVAEMFKVESDEERKNVKVTF